MIPEYSFLGALKWWLTAKSKELREFRDRVSRAFFGVSQAAKKTHAELAMGHAVSPLGQRVGLMILLFLTRARCETVAATQIPELVRAYLVGQAVILQTEFWQMPVAPAGRKVHARPRAPQLFTGVGCRSAQARRSDTGTDSPSEVVSTLRQTPLSSL